MNRLRKRLVHAAEQDQELGAAAAQVVIGQTKQWAALVYRMHDRPAQGEEGDALALKLQRIEAAYALAVFINEAREQHLASQLDNLVRACVGDAKHKRGDAAIRCNDRRAAEDDLRRRA